MFSLTKSAKLFHHQINGWSGSSTAHRAWNPLYGQTQHLVIQVHNIDILGFQLTEPKRIIQLLENYDQAKQMKHHE